MQSGKKNETWQQPDRQVSTRPFSRISSSVSHGSGMLAEAKDVFERAADFAKMKIDADAFEQFKQRLGTDRFDRLRTDAAVVHPLVGHDVNGQGTGSMAINMKKAPGLGVGRGAPRCYT